MVTRQPRKQRKRLYTKPWHQRHKLLTARLAPDLAEKYGIRNLPVHKGDTVLVCRGAFRDSEGTVTKVDMKTVRIHVENITIDKVDGSAVPFPIPPCNVLITKLAKLDEKRQAIIDRKAAGIQESQI